MATQSGSRRGIHSWGISVAMAVTASNYGEKGARQEAIAQRESKAEKNIKNKKVKNKDKT